MKSGVLSIWGAAQRTETIWIWNFWLSVTADSSLRSPTGGVEVLCTTPHIYEQMTAQSMATSLTCLSTTRWSTLTLACTWSRTTLRPEHTECRSLIHTVSHHGSSRLARVIPSMHGHLCVVWWLFSSPVSFSSSFRCSPSRPSRRPSPRSTRSSCPKTCATSAWGPWPVMTTRHPSQKKSSKNWTSFLCMIQRNESLFEDDSKNRTLFWIRLNESNPFLNMTQWIELSLTWLEELNFFFWKKKRMTQRIEISWAWVKELNFWFFLFKTKRIKELSFSHKYDTKNWTFFFQYDSIFFKIWLEEFNPSFYHDSKTLLFFFFEKIKEFEFFYDSQTWTFFFFNFFFWKKQNDSKNWSLFLNYVSPKKFFWSTNATHRTDFFLYDSQNWFFWIWLFFLTLNFFFFWIRLKVLKFSNTTQRIQLFFLWYVSKNCTSLSYEPFLHDSKNLTLFFNTSPRFFSKWVKELNPFFEYDSKNWPFKKKGSKNWTFFFEYDSKNWTLFFWNMTQRIEPFFLEHDSKELNLFLSMNQRIESLSEYDSKNRTLFFFEYDSMNRTHFLNVTQIEIFGWKIVKKFKIDFFTWPEESNPLFFSNMTQRIEPFSIGLKDLMLFSLTQRIELFLTRTDRIGPFSWIWLRELNFFLGFLHVYFFQKMMQRIEPFFLWIWRKELNPFFFECDVKNLIFFLNMTQRIEPFSHLKQRNELLFLWYGWLQEFFFKQKNTQWIELFEIWLKELNIWTMCQKKDSENGTLLKWFFLKWLIELNFFFLNLFKMTQRVEVFLQYDSKNWTLCFSQNVSKNWFFSKCSKNWTSLSFELLFYMTQWIELFSQFDSTSCLF